VGPRAVQKRHDFVRVKVTTAHKPCKLFLMQGRVWKFLC